MGIFNITRTLTETGITPLFLHKLDSSAVSNNIFSCYWSTLWLNSE